VPARWLSGRAGLVVQLEPGALQYLNVQSNATWLCAGDFNKILDAQEQFGGVPRLERQMDGFRDAVSSCGFTDRRFIGLSFTWDNRQHGDNNIKVRLDRAFANADFSDAYKDIKVWHVQTTESDHCCLVIECYRSKKQRGRRRKNFKYENMWHQDPSYLRLVKDSWGDARSVHNMSQLQEKLGQMEGSFQG